MRHQPLWEIRLGAELSCLMRLRYKYPMALLSRYEHFPEVESRIEALDSAMMVGKESQRWQQTTFCLPCNMNMFDSEVLKPFKNSFFVLDLYFAPSLTLYYQTTMARNPNPILLLQSKGPARLPSYKCPHNLKFVNIRLRWFNGVATVTLRFTKKQFADLPCRSTTDLQNGIYKPTPEFEYRESSKSFLTSSHACVRIAPPRRSSGWSYKCFCCFQVPGKQSLSFGVCDELDHLSKSVFGNFLTKFGSRVEDCV